MVFLKGFLEKVDIKKNQQTTEKKDAMLCSVQTADNFRKVPFYMYLSIERESSIVKGNQYILSFCTMGLACSKLNIMQGSAILNKILSINKFSILHSH